MAGGASSASILQFSYHSYSFGVFCDPSTVTDNKEWWLYPLAMYPCPIITCHLCNCPPTVPLGIHPIMKHNGFLGYQENGQCEGWLQLLAMNKWLAGQKNTWTELQRLVEIQILDSAVFRKGQKSAINDVCENTKLSSGRQLLSNHKTILSTCYSSHWNKREEPKLQTTHSTKAGKSLRLNGLLTGVKKKEKKESEVKQNTIHRNLASCITFKNSSTTSSCTVCGWEGQLPPVSHIFARLKLLSKQHS